MHATMTKAPFLTFCDAAQEVLVPQFCSTFPQCNHTRLDTDCLQLRAVKLVRAPRKLLKVHITVHRHLPGVDLENSSTRGLIWKWEFNLPIQPAGS